MVLEMPNQPRVALARWMHHVCAEVAGRYPKSADSPVRLGFSVTISGCVGRPSPMVVLVIRFAVVEMPSWMVPALIAAEWSLAFKI